MDLNDGLYDSLKTHLNWGKPQLECFVGMINPLRPKKHGCPEQSLFRYGLDYLTDHLLHGFRAVAENLRLWMLFLWPPDLIVRVNGNVTLLLKTAD